ncbi:EAL domain-containing protein [Shewanella pneumatophori]|uniref:EAL domain-containing protein n=1 Tax=Shewanella pneumatophori TaxID=314092 RepID=A0A9X1ZJH4_9GAMM|nr:EAL domain-containing protein [Shewanella pneumatophori]MCL1141037.1 EAL domain-containing protein [Shewanella pneumatophori]
MQTEKKIVLVIFGVCVPLLIAVFLTGITWLRGEIEVVRTNAIEKYIKSIESQITNDLDHFQLTVDSTEYSAATAASNQVWTRGELFNDTQVFLQTGNQLSQIDGSELKKNSPITYLSPLNIKRGIYFSPSLRQAFFIATKPGQYLGQELIFTSQLTAKYFESLGLINFVTNIEVLQGSPTTNLYKFGDVTIAELNLPASLGTAPAHLKVSFSNPLILKMEQKYTLLSLAIFLLFIILQIAGLFWLRFGLVKPFKKLTAEFANLDPKSAELVQIHNQGVKQFTPLTSGINNFLQDIYQHEHHSKITLAAISEAVILTDINANVTYINAYAERLLQCTNQQAIGKNPDVLLGINQGIMQRVTGFMQSGDLAQKSLPLTISTEPSKLMSCTLSNLTSHSGQVVGAVLVIKDTTREVLLVRQLKRSVHFDRVTGLLNRTAFEERLPSYIEGTKSLAAVYLDLEQFKLINESCGFAVGDKMLCQVAKALEVCLSQNELLGRLDGDEFCFVIKDTSALEIAKLTKRIIASIHRQVITDKGTSYRVGVSVGVALARLRDIDDVCELLKDANVACLAAKKKGSNQIHFYDSRDRELSSQRNAPAWALRIVQAIENNELILYYQKIKRLSSHSHRQRMEILLRIQDASGRILPPAQFIAAAERFKLIVEVDKEVIRKAFLWLSLNEQVWHDHCLSINLSGNSLGAEGMVNYILQQQARFGIPSSCVCFEITETSAIQNHSRAMKMLFELRKRGFAFALDDFGSGFASYGYLKEMPVDYVKIDGCFVKHLASNAKDYAIVKSVSDVCRVMGIETVAEFVENQEIIDKLEIIGVNYAQGYGIGRPQPLNSYKYEVLLEQSIA